MPFKPVADESDYLENFSLRPEDASWISIHQAQNLEKAIGRYRMDMITDILKERQGED